MPVPSLADLCLATILRNVDQVFSVGDELPHDHPYIEKILSRISSATQLRLIETNSPQLEGHTGCYWKVLIHKDFPNMRKKNYVPSNPAGWWKVYRRYKREHEESLNAATAALKGAFAARAKQNENNATRIVDRKLLPTQGGQRIGARRGSGQRAQNSSSLAFTAGSRTAVTSGKSILKRARREARDIAFKRGRLGAITRPGMSQLTGSAPASFREQARIAALPGREVPSTSRPAPAAARTPEKREREVESVVIDVSDDDDADPLFDDDDAEERPTKRFKSGTKAMRDPLFDSDEEDTKSQKPRKAAALSAKPSSSKGTDTPKTAPRPMRPLLPGKPGASRLRTNTSTQRSAGPTSTAAGSSPPAPVPVAKKPIPPARREAARSDEDLHGSSTRVQISQPRADSAPRPTPPRKRKVDVFMRRTR